MTLRSRSMRPQEAAGNLSRLVPERLLGGGSLVTSAGAGLSRQCHLDNHQQVEPARPERALTPRPAERRLCAVVSQS
jgi:hypothetical protein